MMEGNCQSSQARPVTSGSAGSPSPCAPGFWRTMSCAMSTAWLSKSVSQIYWRAYRDDMTLDLVSVAVNRDRIRTLG